MPRTTELTPTERGVLLDLARGLSNIQIGLKQFRSPETIRTHVKNILAKLKARNRAHAVAIAYETGALRCPVPHLPLTQAIPRRSCAAHRHASAAPGRSAGLKGARSRRKDSDAR
ncbi:response regulator transcription factor [Amycolatopsis sp. Hca4]|uniref:response regulator transcription factor n=1 Tax=Amycolatopsis sp. Hca4 TaxID=2742131 RepID=UPI0015901518|nr:LuxR C-terminal-related transcriptional regulator [Amycolatopsis sp. Hca4]QKV74190.1 response regulator transcription factor [Amycolatopsis sp. Hca4]